MISDEDMKVLEGFKHTFQTAIENNYARHFGSRQYNQLNEIFERITGHKYAVNYGCSYCALQFIRAIGHLYFTELDNRAKVLVDVNDMEDTPVQSELEPKPVTDSVPKRKPGRPKKVATNNEQKQ